MMRRIIVAVLFATLPCVGQTDSLRDVEIDTVLNEVQKGLSKAQAQIQSEKMPPLKSVTLTLLTEFKKSKGGKFKILIFSFGKKWEQSRSSELVLTLEPPKPIEESAVSTPKALSDQLVQAIVSAAKGVNEARLRQPPLLLSSLRAEFKFVVKTDTEGGFEFEIVPVSLSLGGDMSKKAVHSVKVEFAKPQPKGKQ